MSLAWRGREWTHPGPWKPAPRPRAPQHLSGDHEQREDTSEEVRPGKAHQGQGGCTFDTHSQNSSCLLQTLLNSGFLTTLNNPQPSPTLGAALFNADSSLLLLLQVRHFVFGRSMGGPPTREAPAGAVWSFPAAGTWNTRASGPQTFARMVV